MQLRNRGFALSCIAGVLCLALTVLTGCVEVEVRDATPAASTSEPFTSSLLEGDKEHNLAVLAVDFDPPLDYQQLIIRSQSVALLVAIENTGTATERDVTVRAQLSTAEDPEFLLAQGASVASIAPGEVQIVRFARLGQIPYHQVYRLEVAVDPVEGERDLNDNHRAFDIQIHQEDTSP
jgi:hypothetical protein